jgi:hypoxanthine phosphoribosyltransferase
MVIDLPNLPTGLWLRLILLLYKAKWVVYPLMRFFGSNARMSWGELTFATRVLVPQISSFNPDVVVGVGIGGTIFGAILAGNLDDKPLVALDRVVTWAANRRESSLVDRHDGPERQALFSGKRILLVHAEIVSGKTTERVLDYLKEFDPTEIRIACTDHSPASSVRSNYSYMRASGIIQKPWRITQTYRSPDDGRRW